MRSVLATAECALADLDLIVTGVGPGPYTGLRVSVLSALTLGLVAHVPVVGVCTLDAFAWDAVRSAPAPVIVATDARRREVYWAQYDAQARRVAGPQVNKPADVLAAAELNVVGPAASLVIAGAANVELHVAALAEVAADAIGAGEVVDAAGEHAVWGEQNTDGAGLVPQHTLLLARPLYLRQPDAQVPLALRGAH